jgi:cell division septation protein DedD
LPDAAAGSQTKRRPLTGRATDRIVVSSGRNFNKSKLLEVAEVESVPVTTQSIAPAEPVPPAATAPAESLPPAHSEPQAAPQQQATLQTEPSPALSAQPALKGFVIQLASYKSEADALAGYEKLRQQHANVVGSLRPGVEKSDLGTGTTFYRLHLGSFPSRQAANSACTSLLAAGERDCLVKLR